MTNVIVGFGWVRWLRIRWILGSQSDGNQNSKDDALYLKELELLQLSLNRTWHCYLHVVKSLCYS